MDNNHTPLPWKLGPTQDTVDDSNGIELAQLQDHFLLLNNETGDYDATPLPYAANAAFIVRAVNNHAALLAALKAFRHGEHRWEDLIRAAEAAIAKAEEA
jgi:hypothetical protein